MINRNFVETRKFEFSGCYNSNNLIILRSVGSNSDFNRIFLFRWNIIKVMNGDKNK